MDAKNADMGALTQEWRNANDRVKEIEITEAGCSDNHLPSPIPTKLKELLEKVKQDEILKRGYSMVPYEFGLVELDKLIVFQKYINLAHVGRLKKELGAKPSEEKIFELCMPFNHPVPDFNQQQINQNSYDFVSPSNDLRFLGAVSLTKEQITGYTSDGVVAGVIALFVGYGSNYLNAISVNNRLILNNGSHRAYTLRDMGVTHVPCVIQKVTRGEELELLGPQIVQTVQLYQANLRPPLLKDFFDPKLRKIIHLSLKARHVQVSYGLNQIDLPT
ncbi:MAG TPA: hypothetical protein VI423_11970 [Paenisporosarcina sp.]|nr:hypothetical protein [Paenisporosarcina sp.]